jgi:alkaline phosphatase
MVGAAVVGGLSAAAVFVGSGTGSGGDDYYQAGVPRARNVIFLLGDGMGVSEITVARDYALGAAGQFKGLDSFTLAGTVSTYPVSESDPTKPEYVTDSAASGTAWATREKTSNGRISTTAKTDEDLPTILELAQQDGFLTGNVSTAEITDATPAVLDSHVSVRGCQGPADMAACPQDKKSASGPGSIAEQTVDHGVDVVLGGGLGRFKQAIDGGTYVGKTVVDQAKALGYTVVGSKSELRDFRGGSKVLGLFNSGNMTTEWNGAIAAPYPGSGPQRCDTRNRVKTAPTEPSLSDMTRKALEILDARTSSHAYGEGNGFFLQVEGASIDKQDHAANACAQIGETVAFDDAIQIALDYQREHPKTLVIVTADHSHTSQIVEAQSATMHSPGYVTTLTTKDGAPMVVNYATNNQDAKGAIQSQSHTGADVPVFASGPGARGVMGHIDQTDLNDVMAKALGLG